jgi:hypothetical protein
MWGLSDAKKEERVLGALLYSLHTMRDDACFMRCQENVEQNNSVWLALGPLKIMSRPDVVTVAVGAARGAPTRPQRTGGHTRVRDLRGVKPSTAWAMLRNGNLRTGPDGLAWPTGRPATSTIIGLRSQACRQGGASASYSVHMTTVCLVLGTQT